MRQQRAKPPAAPAALAPIYIVSKGRADICYTAHFLEAMRVPFSIVIEAQEFDAYAKRFDPTKLLILDKGYQRDYDTCDDLGDSKSKGPGPARNFAWAHALSIGAAWHWVMDDNIRGWHRLNYNRIIHVADGTCFRVMEDFVNRYANVGMAGPNYRSFVPKRHKVPPYIMNTRIYSCNLIRNDLPFRWRARYNEDTDLSLRILKSGLCTVQFNVFLQEKCATQTVKGGNTKEFYAKEGTLPKSRMQIQLHPDCSRLVKKYGRWHHHVDYNRFKKLQLIRKPAIAIRSGVNEYGMQLVKDNAKLSGAANPVLDRAKRAAAGSQLNRATLKNAKRKAQRVKS